TPPSGQRPPSSSSGSRRGTRDSRGQTPRIPHQFRRAGAEDTRSKRLKKSPASLAVSLARQMATSPADPIPVHTGPWTEADLLVLPDDGQRHELVEGSLVVSPPPAGR